MWDRRFGPPLADTGEAANAPVAYKAFVAAMNRKARALGMAQTHYSSAFGDSRNPDTKTSSARDQLHPRPRRHGEPARPAGRWHPRS